MKISIFTCLYSLHASLKQFNYQILTELHLQPSWKDFSNTIPGSFIALLSFVNISNLWNFAEARNISLIVEKYNPTYTGNFS